MAEVPNILLLLITLGVFVAALLLWQQLKNLGLSQTVGEGERGLVYQHGRFVQEVGPGRHWLVFGRKLVRISMKENVFSVANQEVLSADRMPVKATALVTYRITHPRTAAEKAEGGHFNPVYYVSQLALRDVMAELPLEELIDARTRLDTPLTERAREGFAANGCELISMQVRDVILPAEVRRLATDVTRAKLEAAANLERARGEQAALRLLNNAARLLKGNPELMNLRILQTLSTAPGKPAPTIILGQAPGIVPTGGPSPATDTQTSDGA